MIHSFPDRPVKIRKERPCHGCLETMTKGSRAVKFACVLPGEGFINTTLCERCIVALSNLDDGEAWVHGELKEYH